VVCFLFNVTHELGTYRIARRRDTVCSVGRVSRGLPFTASNTSIRYFRHAISLDECRAKLKADYYHRYPDDEKSVKPGEMPLSNDGLTETDVLEVWFAGCHCGKFLLVSALHTCS
jgi:uncharacterized protein (DUF2235 family)